MTTSSVKSYFRFLRDRRAVYLQFNKQLVIGELAGFGAGLAVAESAAISNLDNVAISAYSSAADYGGSIAGFLAVYCYDQRGSFPDHKGSSRITKILKSAFKLWPSVVAADIAFILVRPSLHYVSLSFGLEAGISAAVAHFLAFGVFNLVAIFSRSLVDYARHVKLDAA